MADDDETQDVDAPKQAKTARKSGMIGPILGLLAVLAVGVGFGLYVAQLLAPPETEQETEEDSLDTVDNDQADMWQNTREVVFEDVIVNLKNEVSRYVKVKVAIRVKAEDVTKVQQPDIKRLLREQMTEELRDYSKKELNAEHVMDTLRSRFRDRMNKVLRDIFDAPVDQNFVQWVVISDIMIQ